MNKTKAKLFTTSSCGTQAKSDTTRHTAIQCAHPTHEIRLRMTAALAHVAIHATEEEFDYIVGRATAEAVSIMWEHSEEISADYRSIIAAYNRRSK